MQPEATPRAVTKVGVIGLGRMGRPIARHLLGAGHAVVGCEIAQAARAAAPAGVTILEHPRAVGQAADLILVVVPRDDDVIAVCTGANGLLDGDLPGRVVAVCSSVRPETVRALQASVERAGAELLDLPLTKGVHAAEAGTLTLLAGGRAETLERARPALACFATAIHHVGGPGAAQAVKTVNNLLLWSTMTAAAEALRLGAALGIAPRVVRDALADCSAESWVLRHLDRIRPTWPAKDMAIALDLAARAGESLPVMEAVAREVGRYDRAALDRILDAPTSQTEGQET